MSSCDHVNSCEDDLANAYEAIGYLCQQVVDLEKERLAFAERLLFWIVDGLAPGKVILAIDDPGPYGVDYPLDWFPEKDDVKKLVRAFDAYETDQAVHYAENKREGL